MYKRVLMILFYYFLIANVHADFIQIIPHRNNREIMVDSESGSSNRISKTFENLMKSMNFSTMNFEGQFTTEWPQNKIIHILVNGTAADIREISRQDLMDSLWIINKLQLPIDKQLSLWFILKGDDQMNELKRQDLENLTILLSTISEMDLINLNVSDVELLDFLGTYKHFTNRQVGILAYSLKLENSTVNIPQNIEFVNKIQGLLCGFGETYLRTINPERSIFINKSVFRNLWSCNKKQLKALLNVAQDLKAYGPILIWNRTVVYKLGFLITAMQPNELKEIRSDSIQDIIPDIIQNLHEEQINALTKDQINNMNNEAYTIYKSVLKHDKNKQSGNIKNDAKIVGVLIISVLLFLI